MTKLRHVPPTFFQIGMDLKAIILGVIFLVLIASTPTAAVHHHHHKTTSDLMSPQPPPLDAACSVKLNNGAARTIRIAFGFYGLPRHTCTSMNIHKVMFEPIGNDTRFNYEYDIFMHLNFVQFPSDPRSTDNGRNAIDPHAYRRYRACYYTVEDQTLIDKELLPVLNGTLKKWGDYWRNPSGSTTINHLRALKSQHKVADLIVAQEELQGTKYDIVVNARVDVLFTREIAAQRYHEIVSAFDDNKQAIVLTPDYAQWGGFNDRFSMGHRNSMIKVMRRLDAAVDYCSKTNSAINSEHFIRDYVVFHGMPFAEVNVGYNRRVRSDGSIHPPQYGKRPKLNCTLDRLDKCKPGLADMNTLCSYSTELAPATFDRSRLRGVNKILWRKFRLQEDA